MDATEPDEGAPAEDDQDTDAAVQGLVRKAPGTALDDESDLATTKPRPNSAMQLVASHTDAERETAYDRDPLLGSGTQQLTAAAADGDRTIIDIAADRSRLFAY